MIKNKRGITLVALVITIIVLLILAGISIQAIMNTGLFLNAQKAIDESKYSNAEEKVKLAVIASYDKTGKLNKELLKDNLNKIDGINPQITEVTYDLTVNVDGYEFKITELGDVKYLGHKENNNEDKDSNIVLSYNFLNNSENENKEVFNQLTDNTGNENT